MGSIKPKPKKLKLRFNSGIFKTKKFIGAALLFMLLFPSFLLWVWPPDTFFEVELIADGFLYETVSNKNEMYFNNAEEQTFYSEGKKINGKLNFNKGTRFKINREGTDKIYFHVSSDSLRKTIGTYVPEGQPDSLYEIKSGTGFYLDSIESSLKMGYNFIIPLNGYIKVGQNVNLFPGKSNIPLIHSGSVTMFSQDIFHNEYYKLKEEALKTGQIIDFSNSKNKKRAKGVAFAKLDCCFDINYRVENDCAYIRASEIGSQEVVWRPGFFDRIQSDPWLQIYSLFLGGVLLWFSLFQNLSKMFAGNE